LKTIRKQDSIRAGDRLAAAVSGGADSVSLLCLLLELRAELGIVLSVAHVNHKLRGEESDEDARFVAELAQQHGLELHACDAPLDSEQISDKSSEKSSDQRPHKLSNIEASARELRYAFFRQLARDGRVSKVATAHTLDDQAETVLLRIFRGTGIRGLSSIHPRIIFKEQENVFGELVRPVLGFRRAALLEFLRERGQNWREDSSNLDIAFLRNRLRHRLLPMIVEDFGEAAIEHMSDLAEIARAEEEHWDKLGHPEVLDGGTGADSVSSPDATPSDATPLDATPSAVTPSTTPPSDIAPSVVAPSDATPSNATLPAATPKRAALLPLESLIALPLAAQRHLVRGWLEANVPDVPVSFRLIESVLELATGTPGKRLELSRGWNLRLGQQELLLELETLAGSAGTGDTQDHDKDTQDYEYALAVPGVIEVPELGTSIEACVVNPGIVPEQERGQLLYLGRMPKQVVIRNWRAGDRFWPAHTSEEKKVKELLTDRHATGREKKLWPVAVAEDCGIVWMRGFPVPAVFRAPAGAPKAIWIREIVGMM